MTSLQERTPLLSAPVPTDNSPSPTSSWRLTLFGRSAFLVAGELVANGLLWAAAVIMFSGARTRSVLNLCLVAWTLGLRHGLDADHIVAIDNVTRNLVAQGRLPVTVGLFFSLGHSSIVVGATIAIIIATSFVDWIDDIGEVGGVIGVAVSATFLLILAIINSIVLFQSLRLRAQRRCQAVASAQLGGADVAAPSVEEPACALRHDSLSPPTTCLGRIGRPIFKMIDQPWKMYPVGLLFGFGFDTASEISLLGISALAGSGHSAIPRHQIILLPLLFTAGMTLVDSLDSIFMLHAYALPSSTISASTRSGKASWRRLQFFETEKSGTPDDRTLVEDQDERVALLPRPDASRDEMLDVLVVLTVISISVALLISITELMGLALEKCPSCSDAAENDGGVVGSWWRFWDSANENSGYLGASVIGVFFVVFAVWGVRQGVARRG
ncbi:high-affinity nickel-transport protein-domain-containing protein [Leucosporidium creatinivorum]|uniref:Nickel/cobalt efflux system n=1 Tax=Leucosporidium creatinivorum TaxID=106004 RepID=A0A1Y2E915_9BASI|nr:high-affinity nickel-transport protein-domain-containing protein [Leucosporidium creatinivorum]